MIVEFIGAPGSGKSTIAEGILALEEIKKVKIEYPLMKLYKKKWIIRNILKALIVFVFIFKKMNTVKITVFEIFGTKQEKNKDYLKLIFNFLFYMAMFDKYKESDNIVIFDEGLLHNIWAIRYSSKNKKKMKFNFENILPNIVIKVDCKSEIILTRLKIRNSKTRIEKEVNILEKIKEANEEINAITIEFNSLQNNNKIISVDNTLKEKLEQNIKKIKYFIEERL